MPNMRTDDAETRTMVRFLFFFFAAAIDAARDE